MEKLTPIEKIVEDIYPAFEGMDDYFNKSRDDFRIFCHSMMSGGIAMTIRNKYGLWDENSENHKYFKEVTGIEHPDDMSAVITGAIWDKYHNEKASIEEGYEAGSVCNRDGCKGIIEERDIDGGCSCHINPPCGYCTTPKEICPECGWDAEEEQYETHQHYMDSISDEQKQKWQEEWDERLKKEEEFWEKYRSDEPVDVITFRSRSHTHFSMEKIGMFPIGTSIDTVRAVVRGTFGGRFKQFNEKTGRFHYIAYTD